MNAPVLCSLAALVTATACHAAPASVAGDHVDAYANVARRIYANERDGAPVRASLRRISRDRAAVRGDRAELLRQLFLPRYHVVRLRVVRGGRVIGDVGGRFVVGGMSRGGLEISIQDVLGYVKLVHAQTGQGIVVRGRPGHVVASSPALARATLPSSGSVTIGGRSLLVRSFSEPGFAGEPLRVWIVGS
jgi:hypothetical protein